MRSAFGFRKGAEMYGEMLKVATPKKVAEISLCGAIRFEITEGAEFIKPTEEQIKNLKETFCIDVKLFDGKEQNERDI